MLDHTELPLHLRLQGYAGAYRTPAYLVRVGAHRDPKGPGQAKVSHLHHPLSTDEEVLWLQISVEDTMGVAEGYPIKDLIQITLKIG